MVKESNGSPEEPPVPSAAAATTRRRTPSKRRKPSPPIITTPQRILRGAGVVSAATITPEFFTWQWKGLIPDSALTVIAGAPGIGKSTLISYITARVTRGELEGNLQGTPHNVMWLSREDSVSKTLVPKLLAEDADLNRVLLMDQNNGASILLPAGLKTLEQTIIDNDIKLVIFDPIMSFMETKRSLHGNYPEAVQVFTKFAEMCHARGIAVIGIIHLSKKANRANIDSLVSSIGLPGVARMVLLVGALGNTGAKVLGVVKSNAAKPMTGLVYRVHYVPVFASNANGDLKDESRVEILRPAAPHEVEQSLEMPKTVDNLPQIREILEALRDGGKTTTTDLYPIVKNKLGVKIRRFNDIVADAVSSGLIEQRMTGGGGDRRNNIDITPRGLMLITPDEDEEDEEHDDPSTQPDPPDVTIL